MREIVYLEKGEGNSDGSFMHNTWRISIKGVAELGLIILWLHIALLPSEKEAIERWYHPPPL